MTEAAFMRDLGEQMAADGWPIIPIRPGSKAPGRWHYGYWEDYPEWQRHCERATTIHETDCWSQWPGAGIGIACGKVVGIDIDITDAMLAIQVENIAREVLGQTSLIRIGNAPKRLLVYRCSAPFASFQRGNIQILARGRQFVSHAIHPDTRRPYTWPDERPESTPPDGLPDVAEAQVREFLERATAILPPHMRGQSMFSASVRSDGVHGQRGTMEAIRDALDYIPNNELHYDDWVAIGLAIKGALGEDGRELFLAWSARSPKDDPAYSARKWDREMRAPRAGAGTIYYHARRYGWFPPPEMVLDGELEEFYKSNPIAPFIERILAEMAAEQAAAEPVAPPPEQDTEDEAEQEQEPPEEDEQPERLAPLPEPDGLLALIRDHLVETAVYPHPRLAMAAAINIIGTVMGRRYSFDGNIRPNLYTLCLAPSASGKGAIISGIERILIDAGFAGLLAGSKPASGAAVRSRIMAEPVSLYVIDEFGMFFDCLVNQKAPMHLKDIIETWTEIYTKSDGLYQGRDRADRKLCPTQQVFEPHLGVFGVTNEVKIWQSITPETVGDGSLGRFLIIETDQDYPNRNRKRKICAGTPEAIRDALRAVHAAGGNPAAGNLAGVTAVAAPSLRTMLADDAAMDALDELMDIEVEKKRRQEKATGFAAIHGRSVEFTKKLAMIHAASRDCEAATITLRDVQWAHDTVTALIDRVIVKIKETVGRNELEKWIKEVLKIIRDSKSKGISKNDLTRKTQWLNLRTRDEIIYHLEETDQIERVEVRTKGRPAVTFKAAKKRG